MLSSSAVSQTNRTVSDRQSYIAIAFNDTSTENILSLIINEIQSLAFNILWAD